MQEDDLKLSPRNLKRLLTALMPHGECFYIEGQPGIGKTEIVKQSIEEAGMYMWRHPPGITIDPLDLNGVPYVSEGAMHMAPNRDFWPTNADRERIGKRIVILLDEISQANSQTQAAYMQVLLEKCIGKMEIPQDTVFVATGNSTKHRSGATRMLDALSDRWSIQTMQVDNKDWQDHACQIGVKPEIRGYLNYKPSGLMTFSDDKYQRIFATPRSYVELSKHWDACPKDLRVYQAAGRIGLGEAIGLCAFVDIFEQLPKFDHILANPDTATIPASNIQVMWAIAMGLAEISKNEDSLEAIATYGLRMPGDFSAIMLRDVFSSNCPRDKNGKNSPHPKLYDGKAMKKWYVQHRDVLYIK